LVAIARDVQERVADEELLREQVEQLAVAEDLHDMVIQRMFAAGLALDATIRLVDEPGLAERLGLVVDELDAAIRELRGAIVGLTPVDQRSGYRRSDELGGEDG
jgi:signal transduction histidine kinase